MKLIPKTFTLLISFVIIFQANATWKCFEWLRIFNLRKNWEPSHPQAEAKEFPFTEEVMQQRMNALGYDRFKNLISKSLVVSDALASSNKNEKAAKRVELLDLINKLKCTAEQRLELRSLVISSVMRVAREIPNLTDSWNATLSFREASSDRAIAPWRASVTEGAAYGEVEVSFLLSHGESKLTDEEKAAINSRISTKEPD